MAAASQPGSSQNNPFGSYVFEHDYEHIVQKGQKIVKAGTDILTCRPFAYYLFPQFSEERCDTCFKSVKEDDITLSKCSNCHLVAYCDRKCQKRGWSDGHKYECLGFREQKRFPDLCTRLLFRAIAKLQNPEGTEYFDMVGLKLRRRFEDLKSNLPHVSKDFKVLAGFYRMGLCLPSLVKFFQYMRLPRTNQLLEICGRVTMNMFNILNFNRKSVGIGLYLGPSLFRHSCEPMAIFNYESTSITLRLIKDIPVSLPIEKITVSCVAMLNPSEIRQNNLTTKFYFDCNCERCETKLYDEPMISFICPNQGCGAIHTFSEFNCEKCKKEFPDEYVEEIARVEKMCTWYLEEADSFANPNWNESCMLYLKSHGFCDSHWLTLNMAILTTDSMMDVKQWKKAYYAGLIALKGLRMYVPETDPKVGIYVYKLAEICKNLKRYGEAEKYILEAKELLKIPLGTRSSFYNRKVIPMLIEMHKIRLRNFPMPE